MAIDHLVEEGFRFKSGQQRVLDARSQDRDRIDGQVAAGHVGPTSACRAPCRSPERSPTRSSRTGPARATSRSRKRRRYTALGSCKWSAQADTRALNDLLTARDSIRAAGAADLFIFARGFNQALIDRAAQEGVILVDAATLVA